MTFDKLQAEMRKTPKEVFPQQLRFKECSNTQFQPRQRLTSLSCSNESSGRQRWHRGTWRRQLINPKATTSSNKAIMQQITMCDHGQPSLILKTRKSVIATVTVTWSKASQIWRENNLAQAYFSTQLINSMTKTYMLVTDSLPDSCTLVNEE